MAVNAFKKFIDSGQFSNTLDLLENVEYETQNEFIEWIKANGAFFDKSLSDLKLPEGLTAENIVSAQCFCNSQKITLKDEEYLYYEGIMCGKIFQRSVYHGFNVIKNNVFDSTHLKGTESFLIETRDTEFYYCGINIPVNFISENYPSFDFEKTQHSPLLYKYFKKRIRKE